MKNQRMKRLLAIVPAMLTVLFLLYSFILKEKKNILYKSTDGGQTWQDISEGLPGIDHPLKFYAGDSDLYLHEKNIMYHSKGNLKTPVWEKTEIPELQNAASWPSTSIVFNRSGIIAYNYKGQIYQKMPAAENWLPVHTNFNHNALRTILETPDGTIFLGYDHGLYKSADQGKNWKQVQKGLVLNLVESAGVLISTGAQGIMRSKDQGEHWHWVVSEGGVGIAVEEIKGGFAAIVYNTTTKSRRIHTSLDGGRTWKAISDGLPPSASISSIKQSGKYLVCGHPDGIFRSLDMGKTWISVHRGLNNDEKKESKLCCHGTNHPMIPERY